MKRESKYDEHGWKIIVQRNKTGETLIYLRSKGNHHRNQKPFYLRLSPENFKVLKRLLKELKKQGDKS
ncbi:MAG TPA: hypothetical protein ENG87_01925 [Candidatus Pacearchaeota archaeon]|nr:hypothetical protein BMS3Abin17_00124 [archaeon BMS3Abin17]HDK42111.1 hypothetical protein [Candidatus Pacearchaeota archaeon]HDZ60136.1 hypothetical protein [Candidatus Pacearchaeota archaeon]